MRRSPSIVPIANDRHVYLVLDDFGSLGRAWRETDEQNTVRSAIIQDLLEGYSRPVRVISFHGRGMVAGCLGGDRLGADGGLRQ